MVCVGGSRRQPQLCSGAHLYRGCLGSSGSGLRLGLGRWLVLAKLLAQLLTLLQLDGAGLPHDNPLKELRDELNQRLFAGGF